MKPLEFDLELIYLVACQFFFFNLRNRKVITAIKIANFNFANGQISYNVVLEKCIFSVTLFDFFIQLSLQ